MGMKTMAAHLSEIVRRGMVRIEDAERTMSDPSELRMLLQKAA